MCKSDENLQLISLKYTEPYFYYNNSATAFENFYVYSKYGINNHADVYEKEIELKKISIIEERLICGLLLLEVPKEDITAIMIYMMDKKNLIPDLLKFLSIKDQKNQKTTYPEVMEYIHKLEKGQMDPFQKKTEE